MVLYICVCVCVHLNNNYANCCHYQDIKIGDYANYVNNTISGLSNTH